MRIAILLPFLVSACAGQSSNPAESAEEFGARLQNHRAPSLTEVEPLERALEKMACIGKLDRWKRSYAFSIPARTVDETHIDFELKRAGRAGVEPGIERTFPGAFLGNDDTPTKMAAGRFDRRTGQIALDYCGENLG